MILPTPRRLTNVLALLALTMPALAQAQAYQCRVPAVSAVPKITPDSRPRQLPVTGYTLALSWSPAFCRTRVEARSHAMQCSGNYGRFGLVVHGLWPESSTRSQRTWPQWCPTKGELNPAEIRRNMCMMPSSRLVARQWAKHGSCMVKRPQTYFNVTRILWDSLRKPDYDRISREDDLTAGRIREAFATANRGVEPEHVGVKLNGGGWLQELRICYGKDFRPTRCDKARYGAANGARAKIWRGL